MAHQRSSIRDAVESLLMDETDAGENVYANRETRLWRTELPSICIYTKDESANGRDLSSRQSIRTLQLIIEIKVKATSGTDDALDDICDQVEEIIKDNNDLSGTSLATQYISTEITLDAESEEESGVAILTYQVKYIK
jgi:minor tail protein U